MNEEIKHTETAEFLQKNILFINIFMLFEALYFECITEILG